MAKRILTAANAATASNPVAPVQNTAAATTVTDAATVTDASPSVHTAAPADTAKPEEKLTSAERRIKEYLDNYAKRDTTWGANKYMQNGKTIKSCYQYITGEARKQAQNGCACIEDDVVFGWAVHYFDEDSIKAPAAAPTASASKPSAAKPAASKPSASKPAAPKASKPAAAKPAKTAEKKSVTDFFAYAESENIELF